MTRIDLPKGLMTKEDNAVLLRSLSEIISNVNLQKIHSKIFVELGVKRAGTSWLIARFIAKKSLLKVRFIGVDIENKAKWAWKRRFTHWGNPNLITDFRFKSSKDTAVDVGSEFSDGVAWVLVDACHCYECVTDDISSWTSLLAVGGHILFHDTFEDGVRLSDHSHTRKQEVRRALDDAGVLRDNFSLVHENSMRHGLRVFRKEKG